MTGPKGEPIKEQARAASEREADWARVFFECSRDGIAVFDDDHRIVETNARFARMLGYKPGEMLGLRTWDLDADMTEAHIRRDFAAVPATTMVFETRHRRRDGSLYDVEVSATGVMVDGRRFVVCFCRDITERKRAEAERREREEQLRLFIENAPVALAMFDRDMRYVAASRRWLADFGLEGQDLTGRHHYEVFPDLPEEWKAVHRRGMAGEVMRGEEDSFERTDGSTQWITWEVQPWRRADGEVGGIIIFSEDVTVRHEARSALAESEARFSALFHNQHIVMLIIDPVNTRIVDANPAAEEFYGWPRETLLSTRVSDLNPMPPELIAVELEKARRSRGVHRGLQHRRADGALRDIEILTCPVHLSGRELIYAIVIDVDDQKRMQRDLAETERFSREIQRLGRFGGWKANPRTDFLMWTDGIRHLLEVPPDYVPALEEGLGWYLPQYVPAIRAGLGECLASGKPFTLDCQLRTATGRLLWVELRGIARLEEQGQMHAFGTLQDITERRQAEAALRDGEQRLRLALEATGIGLYDLDVRTGDAVVNAQYARMLGHDPETFVETNAAWAERLHPDDRQLVYSTYEDYVAGRVPEYRVEFRQRTADGAWKWLLSIGRIVERDEQGAPVRMLGIHADLTEIRQAEAEQESLRAQLAQAQKLESIGRLAGGVAHDFNNMLQTILGHSELALGACAAGTAVHASLEEIRVAASRSSDLTRQLLAFARKQTVAPRVLDINGAVEGLLKMLRRLIGEDIDLAWEPGADAGCIRIDPSQVDQLLANLVVNARDAIAGRGRVTIRTRAERLDTPPVAGAEDFEPGEYVRLTVADTGCGMSPEVLAHVFEPFFTTKEAGKGTGLGLATVYGIVKQNRGQVVVESTPGEGTAIHIHLPQVQAEAGGRETAAPKAPRGRGELVLFVEDEAILLRLGTAMLEASGYKALAAGNAQQAMRHVEAHGERIALLLTDVVMPDMNGRELAELVRELCPGIRVLFMSGYTADVIAPQGVLDDGMHFLEKPFTRAKLAAKVREVLEAGVDG